MVKVQRAFKVKNRVPRSVRESSPHSLCVDVWSQHHWNVDLSHQQQCVCVCVCVWWG